MSETIKDKMVNASESVFEQIQKWHEEDRRITICRTFDLGDLLVNATIATGISEYEVICRIRGMLGELAMGTTSYNRAARMARVFTQMQRKVLIDKMVSLARCEILAGDFYDGKKRINVIQRIKAGKIKAPWTEIQGVKTTERERKRRGPADRGVQECGGIQLALKDDADTVANKLRGFLSKRSDAIQILEDVMAGIKPAIQIQHPENWRKAI